MHHRSRSYKLFSLCNNIFLLVLGILCILPLIHILAVSFSASAPANANLVRFFFRLTLRLLLGSKPLEMKIS